MNELGRIICINGHYEAYNGYGEFLTSGDTYRECEEDLLEMLEESTK